MAIDSRDKRAAGVNVASPWRAILPAPDGTVGQLSDRQVQTFLYPIILAIGVFVEPHRYLYMSGGQITESGLRYSAIVDSVAAPSAVAGYAVMWVDSTTGDLKVIYADGTIRSLSGGKSVVSKTGTYTITASDDIIDCNGTFTVTLPTAVGISGTSYTITNTGTGTITVDGDGTETIIGELTQPLTAQWDSMTVYSNGTSWRIR